MEGENPILAYASFCKQRALFVVTQLSFFCENINWLHIYVTMNLPSWSLFPLGKGRLLTVHDIDGFYFESTACW